jgi:glucose-6-phosphate isomerase
MVGHYWLRNPELAPSLNIREEIESAWKSIKEFTQKIHKGLLTGENGRPFRNVLVIGIGGSSLGPRFVAEP